MWNKGEINPTESGYYLTYYYNHDINHKCYLYKAFWYDINNGWELRFWKCNGTDIKWWWDVRHDYYVPCQTQSNVGQIPE